MRIQADENIDSALIDWLRGQGHDVLSVRETARGASDHEVLDKAVQEDRVLLTADKDFGSLVYRQGSPAAGVILLRFRKVSRQDYLNLFIQHFPAIASAQPGRFVTVTNRDVRIRPLFSTPGS